jgi:hypothetical protein
MPQGDSRTNGISDRESNSQPTCENDQDIGHTSTGFLVSVGPIIGGQPLRRKPPLVQKSRVNYSQRVIFWTSLARPSLLHRLDREGSKIFVHPLGTRLDVCNGHTRSLSQCHLVWWTNAKEPRRISKPLHKSDAAPRLEHPIDVTRSIVGDESPTCRQHLIRAQDRVFNHACSRCTQEDRRAATVYRASKNIVSSLTHTRASMTVVN